MTLQNGSTQKGIFLTEQPLMFKAKGHHKWYESSVSKPTQKWTNVAHVSKKKTLFSGRHLSVFYDARKEQKMAFTKKGNGGFSTNYFQIVIAPVLLLVNHTNAFFEGKLSNFYFDWILR